MSKPTWAHDARTGPVRSYLTLKLFACEGLICIVDERPGAHEGEYTVVTPDELAYRVRELSRKYRGKGRMDLETAWQRQEHDAKVNGSQACMECIREAKDMGDPSDPRVQLYWQRHRRVSSVRISFSPGSDPAGYPNLPQVSKGKNLGNYDLPVAPVPTIHRRPQKKNRSGLIILE